MIVVTQIWITTYPFLRKVKFTRNILDRKGVVISLISVKWNYTPDIFYYLKWKNCINLNYIQSRYVNLKKAVWKNYRLSAEGIHNK